MNAVVPPLRPEAGAPRLDRRDIFRTHFAQLLEPRAELLLAGRRHDVTDRKLLGGLVDRLRQLDIAQNDPCFGRQVRVGKCGRDLQGLFAGDNFAVEIFRVRVVPENALAEERPAPLFYRL